jgi:signal transduction histidine kinase
MDPEIQARLFEPFTQADQSLNRGCGGLGLGLAPVKNLIELHRFDLCVS